MTLQMSLLLQNIRWLSIRNMQKDLYIFVDESGDYSRGEYYTVESCWCLSNHQPQHVLENALGELAKHVGDICEFESPVSELKGTQLPNQKLGPFLKTFEDYVWDDGTVLSPPYPWTQSGRPIVRSGHSFNPELGTEVLSKYMPTPDAPKALQTLALATILNPLTHSEKLDCSQISEIHLIPDAEVWETPAQRVSDILSQLNGPELSVETRDSAKTPGIQIADLMAYSRRNYIKDGSCSSAAEYLDSLQF